MREKAFHFFFWPWLWFKIVKGDKRTGFVTTQWWGWNPFGLEGLGGHINLVQPAGNNFLIDEGDTMKKCSFLFINKWMRLHCCWLSNIPIALMFQQCLQNNQILLQPIKFTQMASLMIIIMREQ